jgi:DNA processing protein
MEQTEHNLLPWLVLKSVPGVGSLLFKRLIDRFESPERVLSASPEALSRVEGVSGRLARSIARFRPGDGAKRELGLALEKGCRIVPLTDENYPPLLKEISDPPPFLYVRGKLPVTRRSISIVGSRHATDYGIQMTRRLCRDLAGLGWNVVSGMALGIDTAAHQGALAGGGPTVAVLGSGLERIYPRKNESLFHQISKSGAVISELPLHSDPDPHHFPARNRIISGMSLGTVVVEAARQSGSLITARLAAEQNREVFAVPGSVQSFKSSGTHLLIKQGAKLVEQTRDILEELSPILGEPAPVSNTADREDKRLTDLPPEERRIVDVLDAYPVHIDDLARQVELPAHAISSILLSLELKGIVQQLPGKQFSKTPPSG